MLISNPDLINSCRVCRNPNQDDDYVGMYTADNDVGVHMIPPLNEAGKIYENLFAKISPETYEYYPRYICNSCDLQMKLFSKLKDKALKTIKYLGKLYDEDLLAAREEQKIVIDDEDEEEFLDERQMMKEEEIDAEVQIGQDGQRLSPLNEGNNENVLGNTVYILPSSIQQANNAPNNTDIQPVIDLGGPLQNQFTEQIEQITELPVVEDFQEIPGIDKSDYVLEIYKVLEDDTQSVASETGQANEVGFDNFDVKEDSASQFNFVDEQYVDIDSFVTAEKPDDYYRPSKRRRGGNKSGIEIGDNIKIYTCTECNEIFTCAKEFKHHRTYIHAQKYTCKICSTVVKSARILSTHMKTHSDTPGFQCEICQRTFTQKIHFQYHMNRHNNIRNFKCDHCDKSFLAKGDLNIHMRMHTGDRPYVCEICGNGYILMEHLKSHALKHTGKQFPCEQCSLKFATPKTLRQHVSTIHAPEPKFKCEYCKKPFRRKHHLQYHMKTHPKDILADPIYSNTGTTTSVDNVDDDLEEAIDDQISENPDDFIKDSGFVALTNENILL